MQYLAKITKIVLSCPLIRTSVGVMATYCNPMCVYSSLSRKVHWLCKAAQKSGNWLLKSAIQFLVQFFSPPQNLAVNEKMWRNAVVEPTGHRLQYNTGLALCMLGN